MPLDVRLLHLPAQAGGRPLSTALRLPGSGSQDAQQPGLCLVFILARASQPQAPAGCTP